MSIAEAPPLDPTELPPIPVKRFTVEEYHRMVESGALDEGAPFELLEGWIVPKMTKKPAHEVAIDLIQEVLRTVLPDGWRLRIQSAITTGESEPEPDLVIARGTARDFLKAHPGPKEIALVIEVSETTLAQDRGLMARIYSRAGLPAYWIVNLVDRAIEVHAEPSGPSARPAYGRVTTLGPDDSVPLVLDGQEVALIAVRDLLP